MTRDRRSVRTSRRDGPSCCKALHDNAFFVTDRRDGCPVRTNRLDGPVRHDGPDRQDSPVTSHDSPLTDPTVTSEGRASRLRMDRHAGADPGI